MLIKFSPNLKREEIWANGNELATIMGRNRVNGKRVFTYPLARKIFVHAFSNPVLVTDNYRIAGLNPTLRDTLFALYASRPRIIEYCGVSTYWDDSHIGVWCPSIDTLLFAKALNKVLKKRKKFDSAIEIGCGSGFLSKYALEKADVKSMVINDLNKYAIKSAMDNIKNPKALFYGGNGMEKLKGHKYDLLICNPPYVPRPGSIDDNPYEGIGLLKHLVHEGQQYLNKGGFLVTNISSLCWKIVMDKKPIMKRTLLEKMKVPLKVNNILNNPKWVSYLERNGLKKKFHNGYEYWQEINIMLLENK